MDTRTFTPDWRDVVVYAAPRPQPALIVDEEDLRVLVVGLEAGGQVPPHPERRAVYHALEGEGVFHLDDMAMPFRAGAVVVAPAGSTRGIDAVTRLAFLAVRVGGPIDAGG